MTRLNKYLLFALGISFSICFLSAQNANEYKRQITVLEEFIQKQMAMDQIPGLSIGFVKDDFMWAQGFGYSDLENRTPVSAESAYRLASNTKSMTAVAILLLVERGLVDLDSDVQTYVPYFPRKRWPVTVRQLLGHMGGISHYQNYDLEGHIKEHKDTRDAVAIFDDFDLISEPGTEYHYSSYGYNLLGAVIEGAARQSYGDFLRENLWGPLDMNQTYMDDPGAIIPNRVQGYRIINGEVKNSEFVDVSSRFAAGGTISTVIDMLKYAKGLDSGRVLPMGSLDLMQTSMATKDGYFTDYGMGWRLTPANGHFRVYHTGSQPETRTLLIRLPRENFALALAYNLEGANRYAYAHRLVQLILDESWDIGVYTGSKEGDALYVGLNDVFNYGLSYYERYHEPRAADTAELKAAFEYFNASVNLDSLLTDYEAGLKKIEAGRHPVADEAFVKVGSYMAAKLADVYGSQRMATYHKSGPIPFFHDYIGVSQSSEDRSAYFRLSKQIEKTVTDWHRDWEKTYTDYARQLAITPFSDLGDIGRNLKRTFSRAHIYPDFTEQLAEVTKYFYIAGDRQRALKTGSLAIDLYPESVTAHVSMANAYVCFGEADRARKSYERAIEIVPDDTAVSAARLNRHAVELMNAGKIEEARALLAIAMELYPREPLLYDTMGEIHLKMGEQYYQKALELDPTFEPAREKLKKIR